MTRQPFWYNSFTVKLQYLPKGDESLLATYTSQSP